MKLLVQARYDAIFEALKEAADALEDAAGPYCEECADATNDDGMTVGVQVYATHETTLWRIPVHLCAKHGEERAASHHKAESKGSGKKPPVVPITLTRGQINARGAIEKVRAALALIEEAP